MYICLWLYTSALLPKYKATGDSKEAGMTVVDAPYMLLLRLAYSATLQEEAWLLFRVR